MRGDTILFQKRTRFRLQTLPEPEIPGRKIPEVQNTPGCEEPVYLDRVLTASGTVEMTGDMRCNNTVERFVPEWDLPYISDSDTDPVRIRAGISAKEYSPAREIDRRHVISLLHEHRHGFSVTAAKFEDSGRTRQMGEGRSAATPEPSAAQVIFIPGVPAHGHSGSHRSFNDLKFLQVQNKLSLQPQAGRACRQAGIFVHCIFLYHFLYSWIISTKALI
jgi:hypothetical protein